MKSFKSSGIQLVVGLALGLLALCGVASPIGTTDDLVTGGWVRCVADGYNVAATFYDCDPCSGVVSRRCSEGYGGARNCTGNNITVVVSAATGATPHRSGGVPVCYDPPGYDLDCDLIYNGSCY